ncbi:MAG TPA: hypothetical protein VGC37_06310 [Friedmanniella sp.]
MSSRPGGRPRVVLVDPSVLGQSHLLVNLGMVRLCAERFAEVEVVAERAHCEALVAYGAASFGQVSFRPYDASTDLTLRLLRSLDRAAPVVFLNLEYKLFLRVMASRFSRGRPVYWVLHSHFASPVTSFTSRTKLLARKLLLFTLFKRSKFIVYGERIRQNLLALVGASVDPDRIESVEHPLGVEQVLPEGSADGPVRIAFVRGWHAPPAATEAVLTALAAAAEAEHAFEFSVISNVVLHRPDGSRVISSDYRERLVRLADIDLVLYLPTNDYALQASGALMDSFVSGRPLIGLQTDFQQEIESLVGPIGFFFESTEQLLDFIGSFREPARRREIEVRRQNLMNGYRTIMDRAGLQLGDALAR